MSYFAIARDALRTAMTGHMTQGYSELGAYVRVVAPTPDAPSLMRTRPVWVIFESHDGKPIGDVAWQPADRMALVQHIDIEDFGIPEREDQLRMEDAAYHVVQWWEEAPGLLWGLQVRQ